MASPPSAPPPPPPTTNATTTAGSEALDLILHQLLPPLLSSAASAKQFAARWRAVKANLESIHSSLSAVADASPSAAATSHPLFLGLLPALESTLRSLDPLAARCADASLPGGRLLLQSDLDMAAATLALHWNDLSLLLRSGLLAAGSVSAASVAVAPSLAGAIVLPLPDPAAASGGDISLFVRDAFARLQIGSLDLKLKALDSLLDLLNSDPAKLAPYVASDGDSAALLRLLEASTHSVVRDRAAAVVALLSAGSPASRRAIFDEGGLGHLLRALESAPSAIRERVASAIEAITADSSSAWALSAYGGVPILLNACRPGSGSAVVQALAVTALKNVASIVDVQSAIMEEGGVPVLVDLLSAGTLECQRSAVSCIWMLASTGGHQTQCAILQEGGLGRLLHVLRGSTDPDVQESTLRAIHALSILPTAAVMLSSSVQFLSQIADLIHRGCGGILTQQTAAALLVDVAPGISDDVKRSMAPCMGSLVKMMEVAKPATVQEVAARALLMLVDVKANRKELVKDEKNLSKLVQLLDPANEEIVKKFPISVVLAICSNGGNGTRRRLVEAGATQHLQKLADADVPGAKRALQRITGNRLKKIFSLGRSS